MSPLPRLVPLALALALAGSGGACGEAGEDGPLPTEPVTDQSAVLGACEPTSGASSVSDDPFADCVDELRAAPDVDFGHDALPDIVLGPPTGANQGGGGLDVASLGCGGSITLGFFAPGIVDVPGPDLLVFENAFAYDETTFAEPGRVLVSEDGVDWFAFPCATQGVEQGPPTGCAGVATVAARDDDAPFDPERAGGDAFDLAEVGLASARWVRIEDRTREHYGDDMWCRGSAGGFDLDAVAAAQPWERAPR